MDKDQYFKDLESNLADFSQGQELTLKTIEGFINSPSYLNGKVNDQDKEWLLSLAKKLNPIDETDEQAKRTAILALLPIPFEKTWENFLASVTEYDPQKDYVCNFFERRFPLGTISYIGARPGRGKTTLLCCLALDALKAGKKVRFITAEENHKQIITRLILATAWQKKGINSLPETPRADLWRYIKATNSQLDLEELANPERIPGASIFQAAMDTIKQAIEQKQLTIFETFGANFETLTRYLDGQEKGSVIFIDYMQHLRGPERLLTQSRQVQLQEVSHSLADIAATKELIILCAAQFKRPENEKPGQADTFTESSFREAGDIEQDGHILIGLGRGPVRDEENSQETAHFFTCLKDREAEPDNGKETVLTPALAWSCFENSGNKYIRPKETKETKAEKTTKTKLANYEKK